MFSGSADIHACVTEPMAASPPMTSPTLMAQGTSHTQSQFLPGYLLGDNSSHGMSSPRLWSTSGVSPGHKSHSPLSARSIVRGDGGKGRGGGPPTRGFLASVEPSTMSSPAAQMRTPGSAAARVASPGPPTTGLFSTPTSRGDVSLNHSSVIPSSPSQLDPFYTQGEALRSDDVLDETWVTVFGFAPGATSFILQQFSQYGNILKHVPSAEGNWMHIHFQSKLQAKKALSKNGKVYGGRMMIGVLPCIDQSVMSNKKNNSELCSTPLSLTPLTSDLNASLTCGPHTPSTPIRPLTAAYTAARSEYEVMKNRQTPQKDNSIVSKVKEYMLGW